MSGAPLGSRAFRRIWSRPYLVDQLLLIWDQRHEDQRQRDEWQYRALALTNFATTFAYNSGVEEKHRIGSVLADMFGGEGHEPKIDPVELYKEQQRAIAKAHRERKEAMKPKS